MKSKTIKVLIKIRHPQTHQNNNNKIKNKEI